MPFIKLISMYIVGDGQVPTERDSRNMAQQVVQHSVNGVTWMFSGDVEASKRIEVLRLASDMLTQASISIKKEAHITSLTSAREAREQARRQEELDRLNGISDEERGKELLGL